MSSAPSASDLKNRGNESFKAGQFVQAAKLYAKAEALDPNDPVYPSNASAALFENADYLGSVEAIFRSWTSLKSSHSDKPDLVVRLSTRLAKALAHGFMGGGISSDFLTEHATGIEELKLAGRTSLSNDISSVPAAECNSAWQLWYSVSENVNDHANAAKDALVHLSRLPMLKKTPEPTVGYWALGTDPVFSLLDGWLDGNAHPLDIDKLQESQLNNVGLLFGGVGDGRHAYATTIGINKVFKRLGKSKQEMLNVHLTLLDIHPGILARDLVLMMLAYELGDENLDPVDKLEIQATAIYTFAGVAMPSYCAERLRTLLADLRHRLSQSPPCLPEWLHVDSNAVQEISRTLVSWLTIPVGPVKKLLDAHIYINPERSGFDSLPSGRVPPAIVSMMKQEMDERRQQFAKALDSYSPNDLRMMGLVSPDTSAKEAKRLIQANRDELVERMMQNYLEGPPEEKWYKKMKIFLPPPELRPRHTKFVELAEGAKVGGIFGDAAVMEANKHIYSTWESNMTNFYIDPVRQTKEQGYPNTSASNVKSLADIHDFLKESDLVSSKACEAADDAQLFFSGAAFLELFGKALRELSGHIKIELLAGGLIEELAKMRFKADVSRPAEFPRFYTRMWLSNVPDYTHGLLNVVVYTLPNVDQTGEGAAACNSLTASGAWKGDDEFCHTYTLLPLADIPRYLGCRIIRTDGIRTMACLVVVPQALPRPLSELATKQELLIWLTRQLMNILIPGASRPRPNRILLPNNLTALVGLLVHLHDVGFPGHWLGEFLQTIISDNMVTDIVPYRETLPIPVSDADRRVKKRKVRLDPWLPDLENTLAVSHKGIPFAFTLPADFARFPQEIGLFSAPVEQHPVLKDRLHPRDPTIILVFHKEDFNSNKMSIFIQSVLEGGSSLQVGDLVVLTASDAVDHDREIRWRMSRRRAEGMMAGPWFVAAFRSDIMVPATRSVPSSQWVKVN